MKEERLNEIMRNIERAKIMNFDAKQYALNKIKQAGLYHHEEHSTDRLGYWSFIVSHNVDRTLAACLSLNGIQGLTPDAAKDIIDTRFANLCHTLDSVKKYAKDEQ